MDLMTVSRLVSDRMPAQYVGLSRLTHAMTRGPWGTGDQHTCWKTGIPSCLIRSHCLDFSSSSILICQPPTTLIQSWRSTLNDRGSSSKTKRKQIYSVQE